MTTTTNAATGVGRTSFKDMIRKAAKLPPRILLHAGNGWGKTSFAQWAPKPLNLCSANESGLDPLIECGLVPENDQITVASYGQLIEVLRGVAAGEAEGYKTLILDTVDGFEDLCREFVCQRDHSGVWGRGGGGVEGFTAWSQGDRTVQFEVWPEVFRLLDQCRDEHGFMVICLSHTRTANRKNPDGFDYRVHAPQLRDENSEYVVGWADIVIYGRREVEVTKDNKARGGRSRVMVTSESATITAKNRYGLPEEIDADPTAKAAWDNFCMAMKEAKKGGPK
tara:strand:- start:596 stop:1438 length:843 start_codon:yes stop_codon:yes gene_type:complete